MDDSNATVVPLFNIAGHYVTIDEFLEELEEQGYPLPRKQIDFRRKSGEVNGHQVNAELTF